MARKTISQRIQLLGSEEVRKELAALGYGTIQRFFARDRITRKKRPRTPASRTVPTS